jgi:putative transposase
VVVDTMGNLLTVVVHSAGVQDYHGARPTLLRLGQSRWPRLSKIWADAIYKGDKALRAWVEQRFGWKLEVVERDPQASGFQVLSKRWVVERTFAWLGRNRRLSKDYEFHPVTSQTWIYAAMSFLMARRLALNP